MWRSSGRTQSRGCRWLAGDVWEFADLDGYETPIKDGYLNDVFAGDLNNDGRKDLVFLETEKNYIDLVLFDSNHKLVPADRWQAFEQHTFRNRNAGQPEPREAAGGGCNRRREERFDRRHP